MYLRSHLTDHPDAFTVGLRKVMCGCSDPLLIVGEKTSNADELKC
jgi:hypothetical protein